MKLLIALVVAATTLCTTNCAQLNNNYLPPAGASQAGGTGLQAPRPGSTLGGANVPISAGRPQAPSPLRPPTQAGAASPSAPSGPPIEIISYESVNNGDGSYKWSFESANGIKAEEMGDVKNKGSENAIQTAQGSYSYTSPEGQVVQITYTADENGFEAKGDAIPTPVPLPEANLLAIAEFEAAFATAVPDTSPQQPAASGGARPSSSGPGQAPRPPAGPNARPGPSPSASRPVSPPGAFPSQPRPGGGSGNYSPQSGYNY